VSCWGSNSFGQLGHPLEQTLTPAAVSGLTGATTLAIGSTSFHTCVLVGSGAALCWGRDAEQELGNGSNGPSAVPDSVTGGHVFTSISLGTVHTCAVASGGTAYCWGSGSEGQLGFSSGGSNVDHPTAIPDGRTYTVNAAGLWHSCGLADSGSAYCTGSNYYGELGDSLPTISFTPIAVTGGHLFTDIAAGVFDSCALTGAGAAFCWGSNTSGQLGDSSTVFSSPHPRAVAGALTFTTLTIGAEHVCGLVTSGAAYCWGSNFSGQLGNGSNTKSNVPVPVSGSLTFSRIAAGARHTCALTTAGSAFCWGFNGFGELGNGTTDSTNVPVAVSGGLTFSDIQAGNTYSCGLRSTGSVYCWGDDYYGQLGHGIFGFATVPTSVVVP
jgi:alpha-tubulin suppressor-like RCC1 family protein